MVSTLAAQAGGFGSNPNCFTKLRKSETDFTKVIDHLGLITLGYWVRLPFSLQKRIATASLKTFSYKETINMQSCYLVHWCRGLTCLPVTEKTTSSNLVCTALIDRGYVGMNAGLSRRRSRFNSGTVCQFCL